MRHGFGKYNWQPEEVIVRLDSDGRAMMLQRVFFTDTRVIAIHATL